MQQATRLSRSFFLQQCTSPAVAPPTGVQLAYRVWRKPLYVAGRYLKLLRGVAQVCCAPPYDTTGKEYRTPFGERPPEAAVDTTTCLIAPDPSSACAVFDELPLMLPLLWLDSGWTVHFLQLCLHISCAPVVLLSSLCLEQACKVHIWRYQSETGSNVRKPKLVCELSGQLSLDGMLL